MKIIIEAVIYTAIIGGAIIGAGQLFNSMAAAVVGGLIAVIVCLFIMFRR